MGSTGGAEDPEPVVDITPRAEDEAEADPAPRWLGPLLVVGLPAAVAAVLGWVLYWQLSTASAFPATDSRACPGSVEPLGDAADRLGVRVPADARDVHYLTSSAASGKPLLQLAFRLPPRELDRALEGNGLMPWPSPQPPVWSATGGMCGLGDAGDALTRWTGAVPASGGPLRAEVSTGGAPVTVQVLLTAES
ncbi:hypothetical protein LO771_09595 [Streptacidiphilus sp. ASG 303]|uniref:hypothetical protein n=1 Tax=Streptacidiphilus sp. ASG 303 TaxID=2896847 RepID=UPI001E3B879B|nr:hypothetical protein [Streptacidiphilus sp. ASG 303]MCD0482645.1 hypothetical protein [Streptacidiphilus sp. ASG 303]